MAGLTPTSSRALVIGDDIGVFLAVARSLGRAGIAVDVATCGEDYPGLKSRYISDILTLPPYLSAPDKWVDAIREIARGGDYSRIIPSSDSSLDLLALAAQGLAREHAQVIAVPHTDALATFASKSATRILAQAHRVPVCEGVCESASDVANSGAAAGFTEAAGFPVIVKASQPYLTGSNEAKAGVHLVENQAEFTKLALSLGEREIVIERYFEGQGVGVSVIANAGEIELAWQHRRLAQSSRTGRSSQRRGERVDPALLKDVEALCRAVRFTGVAMFEFRQNVTSGEHVLLEVNPRFWGSLPLAIEGGADFPLALWRMLEGEPAKAPSSQRDYTITKTSLLAETDRISEESGAFNKAAQIAALLAMAQIKPNSFDGWAKDDPAPHRAEVSMIVQRLCAAVSRRLSQRSTRP